MKASEALIAWNGNNEWDEGPLKGQVKVGPLLREGPPDWTRGYRCSGGAAMMAIRKMPKWQGIAMLFIEFQTLVVNYKIDPQVVHDAFLAIDEYRQRISRDSPGAEDIPDGEAG